MPNRYTWCDIRSGSGVLHAQKERFTATGSGVQENLANVGVHTLRQPRVSSIRARRVCNTCPLLDAPVPQIPRDSDVLALIPDPE